MTSCEERLIRVTGLNRYFGRFHAVKDLSFDLRRGEVLGFLGPNGAGKSTTMKMLCGALAPHAGRVEIAGEDLIASPKTTKRSLGYLPQTPPLYPELTVDEYLAFCAKLRGVSRVPQAVDVAKNRCGLAGAGARIIRTLSRGFQQRVGIAQALVHNPSIVILDEPTSGLDPNQIRDIRALIRALKADHGVLLSTHILPEVSSVCDRVQIMHEGKLVLDSRLDELNGKHQPIVMMLRKPDTQDELAHSLAQRFGPVRVTVEEGRRYALRFAEADPPADVLAQFVVERGWGLLELRQRASSLEEIFVELTCTDAPAGASTALPGLPACPA